MNDLTIVNKFAGETSREYFHGFDRIIGENAGILIPSSIHATR